jgi:hypothetical protein
MGGIVKLGDYLFTESFNKPELKAVDAGTGEITDTLRIGSGALISDGEKLYYYSSRGTMFLLEQNEGKVTEVSSFKIKKGNLQHFAHPVINKGILYVRHGKVLIAYDIRDKG